MENPIKMDDLGVPLFFETPICICDLCYLYWLAGFLGSYISLPGHTGDGDCLKFPQASGRLCWRAGPGFSDTMVWEPGVLDAWFGCTMMLPHSYMTVNMYKYIHII